MQYLLREEVRDALNYTISTDYHILHRVLLLRSEACEFDPEIVAVLLELVLIGYLPVIEVAHHEDMLSSLCLASSISTESNLSRIVVVVVDTHIYTCWACLQFWDTSHASERLGLCLLVACGSCKFEVVVATLAEGIAMLDLSALSLLHELTIDIEFERSLLGRLAAELNDITHRRDLGDSIGEDSS